MKSKQMALCGLLTALAVVLMILAGAMGIGTFAGPVLAMAALLPVLEEYGPKAAAITYAAAAILGLLLVPETELAMVYAAFGWYPILRPRTAALPALPVRIGCRLAVYALAVFALYGVVVRLFGLTAVLEELGGAMLTVVLAVLGFAVFLLLDLALGRLTVLWHRKLRRRFLRT